MLATPETAEIVHRNWQVVCERVARACESCGRSPEHVTIVGVSKYVDASFCRQLFDAGCQVLGENRPQALWEKWNWFNEQGNIEKTNNTEKTNDNEKMNTAQQLVQPQWHLIGHLQRNKVRRTLPLLSCLQSLDSLRLAGELSREAVANGSQLSVLVEVNVTQDTTKTGLAREELQAFVEQALALPGIKLDGLMAMASLDGDKENARREFAEVRQLRDQLNERFPSLQLSELSMGMSGDFEEAIAEGATLVRIGSSLWHGIMEHA